MRVSHSVKSLAMQESVNDKKGGELNERGRGRRLEVSELRGKEQIIGKKGRNEQGVVRASSADPG